MIKVLIGKGHSVRNPTMSKGVISSLFLMLSSVGMVTDASATNKIFTDSIIKGIKVTSCQSCHTGSAGRESKANLKLYDQASYKLDKVGLTRLKSVINGCAFGQALNKTNFLCQAPITKPGAVGLAGSGAAKTDVYSVTCGAGTASLTVAVLDMAPIKAPLISIQATKLAAASALSTDGKDGETLYSPLATFIKGAGVYSVKINKSAYVGTVAANKGAETYTALFSCRNAVGTQTVTTPVLTQNQ